MRVPTFSDVEAARDRLRGHAVRTPLLRSDALDAICGAQVHFKAECLQHVGAFKYRGARNRLAALDAQTGSRGVVAFSSGNHAQGVARAARELGIDAVIVMPHDAPVVKVAGVRADGATIVGYDRATESREDIAAAIAERDGRTLVPSFDDPHIIAGQGTCALEAIEDGPRFDAWVTCVGGGGLAAGNALAFGALSPGTRLYGAEPEGYDDHRQSLARGERVRISDAPPTLCDAIMTPQPGEITWAINGPSLSGVFTVSDADCLRAMRLAWEHLGVKLEPGGAAAMAAVCNGELKSVGVVGVTLSGGNVDDEVWAMAVGTG